MAMTEALPAASGPRRGGGASPLRRFGRKKFDKQPTQSAAVLIASNGEKIPNAVLRQALQLSQGEPVAVVTLARIYGSAYGLPNPGLMPTKREMADQHAIVRRAMESLEKVGCEVWGQVAATRKPVKTISAVAQARQVRHVLVVRNQSSGVRGVIEGDLAKDVARRVGPEVTVEGVAP